MKSTASKNKFSFKYDCDLSQSLVTKAQSVGLTTATDDFGQKISIIDGVKPGKPRYVGMFYFTWHGEHKSQQTAIYNNTILLAESPQELWSASSQVSPADKYHYWGEPLFGYYSSRDPWVIRRHIQLLTYAGVDFIGIDATNGFEYLDVLNVMLPIMQEYFLDGWAVPKIVFYTNSGSCNAVRHIYSGYTTAEDPSASGLKRSGIYSSGLYKDLWFCPNGKPLIIGITKPTNMSAGNNSQNIVTDPALLDFFEFKQSQWPNMAKDSQDGFPWLDFARPQSVYGDVINVSVAQHQLLPFSDALLSEFNSKDESLARDMWGRGYSGANALSKTTRSNLCIRRGDNFQEQWDVAKAKDVKYTFITGFNEWIALKIVQPLANNTSYPGISPEPRVTFVDTVNEEFSRDLEPMKGGYKDNFYLQTVRNIRQHKGNIINGKPSESIKINIKKGLKQWNNAQSVYYNMTNMGARKFANMSGEFEYTNNTVINDIQQIRVAHDSRNIYFLIKTVSDNIVDLFSGKWLNIIIKVNSDSAERRYIINREPKSDGKTSVHSYNKDVFSCFKNTGSASFTLKGEYMQVKVPKKALLIGKKAFCIDFKVADNVSDVLDSQSFYVSGCCAPLGSLYYRYCGRK